MFIVNKTRTCSQSACSEISWTEGRHSAEAYTGDRWIILFLSRFQRKQLPELEFLFKVLWTVKTETMRDLIKQSRSSRSVVNQDNENQMIVIKDELRKEISNVLAQKSKL